MKTQIIHFSQELPCFYNNPPRGMLPHTLSDTEYEVSNLVVSDMNYITFDLYDDQGFIGHYIVFNVSLTKQEDGSMIAVSNLRQAFSFDWNYHRGHNLV